jgi:hypothetical protein
MILQDKCNQLISFFNTRKYTLVAMGYVLWGLFWLLGNWPGAMTQDSLVIWDQSAGWQYGNDHPWFNAFSYSIARLLWDSPACIAMIQILAFSVYFACVLAYFHRRGVQTWFIGLLGLSFAVGLPIWLYAITLWKDVPFTLCLIAAIFAIYRVIQDYRENGRIARSTTGILLSAYIVGVFAFRHNGLFGFGFLFFMLHPAFGAWKRRGLLFVGTALCIVLLIIIIPSKTEIQSRTREGFYLSLTLINPIAALHHAPGGYRTPNPELDRQVLETVFNVDCLKQKYDPIHMAPILCCMETDNVKSEQAYRIVATYIPRLLQNPGILITDRLHMLQSTVMHTEHRYGMRWYNCLANPSGLPPTLFEITQSVHYHPVKFFMKILTPFNYLWQRVGLLVWNAVPGLILTLVMIAMYRFVPLTAYICIAVLVLTAGTLLLIPADDFRYFFYLYVLAPVLLLMGLYEGRRALPARLQMLLFSKEKFGRFNGCVPSALTTPTSNRDL